MTCRYEYNGLIFKSELELDHYLLFNKNTSKNVFGDAVFKLTHGSDEQILIDEKLEESSKRYEKGENSKQIKDSKGEEGEPSDLDKVRNHLVSPDYYNDDNPELEGLQPYHKEMVGEALKKDNDVLKLMLKYNKI